MPYSLTPKQTALLQECLSLAQDVTCHADAERLFLDLEAELSADEATREVLTELWKNVLAARRSAAFWEQISDVEKNMSEQLASSHLQLRQNYLRLMQEQ